jgi:hypothetical protein
VLHEEQMTRAIWIGRRVVRQTAGSGPSQTLTGTIERAFFAGERLEPPLGADVIDVPLREDRAEPCGKAAAPLKVMEERRPLRVAFADAV